MQATYLGNVMLGSGHNEQTREAIAIVVDRSIDADRVSGIPSVEGPPVRSRCGRDPRADGRDRRVLRGAALTMATPQQRGGNGLLRRCVGKGTNLSVYTPADLRAIETRLNTTPRRSLDSNTAHDRYHAAVAMTG